MVEAVATDHHFETGIKSGDCESKLIQPHQAHSTSCATFTRHMPDVSSVGTLTTVRHSLLHGGIISKPVIQSMGRDYGNGTIFSISLGYNVEHWTVI